MHVYPVPMKWIVTFVVFLHATFLIWLLWLAPATPLPVKPKPFAVQTVQLNTHKQTLVKEPSRPQPKSVTSPAPPMAKPIPQKAKPVKPTPKPIAKTPAKTTPKPIAKTPPKEIAQIEPPKKKGPSKESLDALKQKLAAIPNSTTPLNTSQNKANADAPATSEISFAYEDGLISRLKFMLKLPETGDVKVSLTLNRQGKVVKSEILSSENPVNRKSVETHLPAIQFPPFGQAYIGESTHTFTLTLTNL